MRVAMLGLGLVGGSVARAARAAGMDVRAWTPAGRGPAAAAADGITPAESVADAVRDAHLVVIAAPPLAALTLVDTLADPEAGLPTDAVVTDVTSTKAAIVARARDAGLRFVGGHPLAGSETSGYEAADPDLFRDRPWVIVPPEPADLVAMDRVRSLVAACGARITEMDPAGHDRAVAGISHLPLLLSAALVEAVTVADDWPVARELSAGGWSSMTRLARGDAEMGAGILATNATEVADRLAALAEVLALWTADLGEPDGVRDLQRRLAAARAALDGAEA